MCGSRPEGLRAVPEQKPIGIQEGGIAPRAPPAGHGQPGSTKPDSEPAEQQQQPHLVTYRRHGRQRTAQIAAFLQQPGSHHGLFVPDTMQPVFTLITLGPKEAGKQAEEKHPRDAMQGASLPQHPGKRRDAGRGWNERSTTAGKAPMLGVDTKRTLQPACQGCAGDAFQIISDKNHPDSSTLPSSKSTEEGFSA